MRFAMILKLHHGVPKMKFKISDIVITRDTWKLRQINMIYENGTGNYIELKPVGLADPLLEELSLTNHKDIELVEARGFTVVPTQDNKDLFDLDDRVFRESVEKKRTYNPWVLFRTWLAKKRYTKCKNV